MGKESFLSPGETRVRDGDYPVLLTSYPYRGWERAQAQPSANKLSGCVLTRPRMLRDWNGVLPSRFSLSSSQSEVGVATTRSRRFLIRHRRGRAQVGATVVVAEAAENLRGSSQRPPGALFRLVLFRRDAGPHHERGACRSAPGTPAVLAVQSALVRPQHVQYESAAGAYAVCGVLTAALDATAVCAVQTVGGTPAVCVLLKLLLMLLLPPGCMCGRNCWWYVASGQGPTCPEQEEKKKMGTTLTCMEEKSWWDSNLGPGRLGCRRRALRETLPSSTRCWSFCFCRPTPSGRSTEASSMPVGRPPSFPTANSHAFRVNLPSITASKSQFQFSRGVTALPFNALHFSSLLYFLFYCLATATVTVDRFKDEICRYNPHSCIQFIRHPAR